MKRNLWIWVVALCLSFSVSSCFEPDYLEDCEEEDYCGCYDDECDYEDDDCEEYDDYTLEEVPLSDLPAPATDYINAEHPDDTVEEAFKVLDDDKFIGYAVFLEDEFDIFFDKDGYFVKYIHDCEDEDDHDDDDGDGDSDDGEEDEEEEIPVSALPSGALEYIDTHHADTEISKAGVYYNDYDEVSAYVAYLADKVVIYFDENGDFDHYKDDPEGNG